MIRVQPLKTVICRDPEILFFEASSGGLLCAFDSQNGIGGGILLQENSHTQVEKLLQSLVAQFNATSGPSAVLELKVAGPIHLVQAIRKAAMDLGIPIKGEQILHTSDIKAYFYTDSGRLRVQTTSAAAANEGARGERKIKVLVVDDSKVVRQVLRHILSSDPEIEVVGEIENPGTIEKSIEQLRPDVITLDIHMPEIDGVTLLERYLPKYPVPTVMISSISMEEGSQVLRALELGAVDYIQKPSFSEIDTVAPIIAERVKAAANTKVRNGKPHGILPALSAASSLDQSGLVAIGASTGGTEALRRILVRLPKEIPPIVIVQHIPPVFSAAFAKRLNELCSFEVKEAQDGDAIHPGRVLIAPGGFHLSIRGKRPHLRAVVSADGSESRHKPSVDVLFDSVAQLIGKDAIGLILTGMGTDGAKGLLKMRNAGARTIAQDEASCAVFGMPREAIRIGAAEKVETLDQIPDLLTRWLSRRKQAA